MKILVIGAGYVGSALMRYWHGVSFIATTTSQERINQLQEVSDEVVFLENKKVLSHLISKCDGIVVTVAPNTGSSYYETYLKTAQAITNSCSKTTPLVYTSSTSVYGQQNQKWVDETSLCHPNSEDARVLLETESVYLNAPFLKSAILRLGGIYGPDRSLERRATRFFSAKKHENPELITNHIHLEDILRAIVFTFTNNLVGVCNLVSDAHPTRKELYDRLCKQLQIPLPIWDFKISSKKAKVSNQKIKNYGFTFKHSKLF